MSLLDFTGIFSSTLVGLSLSLSLVRNESLPETYCDLASMNLTLMNTRHVQVDGSCHRAFAQLSGLFHPLTPAMPRRHRAIALFLHLRRIWAPVFFDHVSLKRMRACFLLQSRLTVVFSFHSSSTLHCLYQRNMAPAVPNMDQATIEAGKIPAKETGEHL